ncbi:MAG: FUSC family protein [Rhodocyclaceae bacterium]|nr:MAG: FUSC family protein [Rhodocyclaceae bacterium]
MPMPTGPCTRPRLRVGIARWQRKRKPPWRHRRRSTTATRHLFCTNRLYLSIERGFPKFGDSPPHRSQRPLTYGFPSIDGFPMTQRAIFNHYAYSGFTVSIGIFLVTLSGYLLAGLDVAAGLAMGAICVSVNDVPTPDRHKLLETLSGLVLGILTVTIVSVTRSHTWLMGASVLGISFVAAMITAYGRKAIPLSFSIFFTMILALSAPSHGDKTVLIKHFALGGFIYLCYALVVARILSFRTRQQALGESIQALANYLRIQGNFFDAAIPMDDCYRALIGQQAVVAEKLQGARDLLFRQMRSERDGMLAATLVKSLELFEHLLSIQVDYTGLRNHFAGSDLLMFFRDISRKGSQDLEYIGYALIQGQLPDSGVNYKAELYAIEHEVGRLRPSTGGEGQRPAAMVIGVYDKVLHSIEQINQIRRASHTPTPPQEAVSGVSVEHFLSRTSYNPRRLLRSVSFKSPVFRYALRVALAMGCGYWVDLVLPYTAHGYWILLTIAVIMRSSYSVTRQRQWDRILGNIIGCILAAFLLWATNNSVVLMAVVVTAVGVAHAQATRNYRYTAVAACLMGLLPTHFLEPEAQFLVAERLLDTGVGALIAWGFSFVLPYWESNNIPGLVRNVLKTSAAYTRTTLNFSPSQLQYRLSRKHLIDAIAALGSAGRRMLDEPESQRRAVEPLNTFITGSYLLAAQLASIRLLIQQRSGELNNAALPATLANASGNIAAILENSDAKPDLPPLPEEIPGVPASNAQLLLLHRLAEIRDGARELSELSEYIGAREQTIAAPESPSSKPL